MSLVGSGDTPISKDTGFLVRALLQVPPGKTLSGAGSMLSWKECLQVWCKTPGLVYGGFDEISVDDYINKSGMGPDLGLEFAEMFALMDNPGYNGGEPSVILPKDVRLPSKLHLTWEPELTRLQLNVSCPLTSFEDWCKCTDFSDVVNRNSTASE